MTVHDRPSRSPTGARYSTMKRRRPLFGFRNELASGLCLFKGHYQMLVYTSSPDGYGLKHNLKCAA
eukprot:1672685-Alexandrium_andersonii.AAC.1